MDWNALFLTLSVGGGLLFAGFILGVKAGFLSGSSHTLKEIFNTKLLTPDQLLDFYRKNGGAEYIKELEMHVKKK